MRVLTVLVALMATPVITAVSQDRGHQAATWVSENDLCATADENRSPSSENNRQPVDPKGRDRVGCSPVAPTPAPPPSAACTVSTPPPAGIATINGAVFRSDTWEPIPGWCIDLFAGTSVTPIATTVTGNPSGAGAYTFPGLADGTYRVCQRLPQSGWDQDVPTSEFGSVSCDPMGVEWKVTIGWEVNIRSQLSAFGYGFVNHPTAQ